MKMAQHIADVAKVKVGIELNGACTEENHVFANIIDKCGDELLDIGQHLKSCAIDIKKAREDYFKTMAQKKYIIMSTN